MRTRNGSDEITPLPPPPAPPARDANPWRLPELDRPATGSPSPRRPPRRQDAPETTGWGAPRIALVVVFVLLVLGLAVARMIEGGNPGDFAEALFPLVILAIFLVSRLRRRRRSNVRERRNDA